VGEIELTRDKTADQTRPARWAWPGLAAIVVVYCALAIAQSFATRPQWGPDEPAHIIYVRSLGMDLHFPALTHGEQDNAYLPGASRSHEAHQPPLYYALAGLVWHAFSGLPDKAVTYRDKATGEPRTFTVPGAVRPVRLLSVVFGAITLLFVWAMARTAFPERPELWLGATAMVGFTPMFTYLSGVINNDSLLALIFAAIGWQSARAIRFGAGLREALLIGLLLGLALNVKETALGFLPVTLLVLAVAGGSKPWRGRLTNMLAAIALAALLGGWWFLRKWAIYGTPFVYPFVYPLLGLRPEEKSLLLLALPRQIFLFSVLPYDVIKEKVSIGLLSRFFGVLAVLAAGGFALALARRKRLATPRWELLTLLIWLAAGAVVLAGLVRNVLTVDWRMGTSGGRYLVSVLPLVAPVAARGLWALFGGGPLGAQASRLRCNDAGRPGRWAQVGLAVVVALLLAANVYVIWGTASEYGTLGLSAHRGAVFFANRESFHCISPYMSVNREGTGAVMKANNIQPIERELNGAVVTLIGDANSGVGLMDRFDSDSWPKERAAEALLARMDRTATGYVRRSEVLNSVIRSKKVRQHVAWTTASRERRLHS